MQVKAVALSLLLVGCASTRYVAKVNDDEITGDEVVRVFGQQHVAMERALGDEQDIRRFLDRVIDRRLLVQEAYRLGLQDDPAVQEGTARFEQDQLALLYRKREIEDRASVSQAEVEAAYVQMQTKFLARQVVAGTKEEALALAARVKGGEDPESIARSASKAPSSRRGGLIVVQWGALDDAREQVVFALQDGQVSEVYRSDLGWEFDVLEKRGPVTLASLDEVRPQIEGVLRQRKIRHLERDLAEELWRKYDAKAEPCLATAEEIKKAAEDAAEAGDKVCATWKGGKLLALDVARRVGRQRGGPHSAMTDPVAAVEPTVRQLVTQALFGLDAASRGWTRELEIVEAVRFKRESLMEEKLYAAYLFSNLSVTDEEARAYYDANKERFVRPAAYALAHIVVDTPEAAAQVKAELAAGASFEALAKERSKDPQTAARGGLVGVADESEMKGVFKVVAGLNAGEVSDVIQSPAGYHVVKVLEKRAARQLTWEEAAPAARDRVMREKSTAIYDKWTSKLRAEASIEVNDAGIKAFAAHRLDEIQKEIAERKAKVAGRPAGHPGGPPSAAKTGGAAGAAAPGRSIASTRAPV